MSGFHAHAHSGASHRPRPERARLTLLLDVPNICNTPPTRHTPEVVLIAAVAEAPGTEGDRLIGDGMDLPWHLPADLKRFKALTLGYPLVMGRRTFESLLHQFGGPLPNRENVVLTRHSTHVDHPGIHVYSGLPEAMDAFADGALRLVPYGSAPIIV